MRDQQQQHLPVHAVTWVFAIPRRWLAVTCSWASIACGGPVADGSDAPPDVIAPDTAAPEDTDRSDTGAPDTADTPPSDSGGPDPASRPLEVHPWRDDWTVAVPWYAPEPSCDPGVAARIRSASYPTVQAALDAAVNEDVVVLCDGLHEEALRLPRDLTLELRGRTGDPRDVVLTSPGGRALSFDGPDPTDGGRAHVRLSGLEWREEDEDEVTTPWFARVWQLRDVHCWSRRRGASLIASESVVLQSVQWDRDEGLPAEELVLDVRGNELVADSALVVRDLRGRLELVLGCGGGCTVLELDRFRYRGFPLSASLAAVHLSLTGGATKRLVVRDVLVEAYEHVLGIDGGLILELGIRDTGAVMLVDGLHVEDSIGSVFGFGSFTGGVLNAEIRDVSWVRSIGKRFHGEGIGLWHSIRPRIELHNVSFPPGADMITGCGTYSYVSFGVVDPALGVCP